MRILVGALLAATFVSLGASAASAHVTVQPNSVEQGGRGRFVVRVPNESDTVSTIKVEVQTPKGAEATFASMRVMPVEGWDVEVTKEALNPPVKGESGDITEYVSKATWTAKPGYKVAPDQFMEFPFTTGVLPKDKTSITFKAIQTYDGPLEDGSTQVNWIETRQEGQAEPRRPEALVRLTTPTTAAGGATASATEQSGSGDLGAIQTAAEDAKSAANSARTMGILGLIVGIIALVVAVGAIVSKPKAAPASPAASKEAEPVDA